MVNIPSRFMTKGQKKHYASGSATKAEMKAARKKTGGHYVNQQWRYD